MRLQKPLKVNETVNEIEIFSLPYNETEIEMEDLHNFL